MHLDIRVWMGTSYPTIKLKWPVHAQSQRERERETYGKGERAENVQKHLRLGFGNIRRRIEDWWEVIFVQLFATVKNIVLCLS